MLGDKIVNKNNKLEMQDEILLGMLSAVERNSQISQRVISRDLGVALGLANAMLKRCIRKGWIKVQQVPRRRYLYYLTSQGFAEKTRLAGQYVSGSFTFFRRARAQISDLLSVCADAGWNRVALAGASELAEVATICVHHFPIHLVAVIDLKFDGDKYCGLPVRPDIASCEQVDAVIVTNLTAPQEAYTSIKAQIDPQRVLIPPLLRLVLPGQADLDEAEAAE